MNLHIAYHLIVIGITIAIWNAFVILWGVHKNLPEWEKQRQKYSKVWHSIGLLLRTELIVLPAYLLAWHPGAIIDWILFACWALTFYIVLGPLYDFIINFFRKKLSGYPELWHVDDKGVNAFFLLAFKTEKAVWIFRWIVTLATVALWIYQLTK